MESIQFRRNERRNNGEVYGDLPSAAATTTAARVLGQKLKGRETESRRRGSFVRA